MEAGLVKAILSGDAHAIFGAASAMALSFGLAFICSWVMKQLSAFVEWAKPQWDNWGLAQKLKITAIGDQLLDMVRHSFDNQTHTNATVAQAIADGTVTDAEWAGVAGAAFEDFKANVGLGSPTWNDFVSLCFPKISLKSVSPADAEKAVKARFMANARRIGAERAINVVQSRAIRQRAMAAPAAVNLPNS